MRNLALDRRSALVAVAYALPLFGAAWLSQHAGCPFWTAQDQPCVSPISQNSFWPAYYATFLAALAALIVGLPIASTINAAARVGEHRRRDKERTQRFLALLGIVRSNVTSIARTAELTMLDVGGLPGGAVDAETWSAVSRDVLSSLPNFGELGAETASKLSEFHVIGRTLQSLLDVAFREVATLSPRYAEGVKDVCKGLLQQHQELLPLLDQVGQQAGDSTS